MSRSAKAVIPIKAYERGKTRLRERLEDGPRAHLSREMFERVLEACLACAELTGALVLTDAPDIARAARERGADVLEDPPDAEPQLAGSPRLARLVDRALAHLRAEGVDVALVLMADLPQLSPADLSPLLAAVERCDVVLTPDLRGECTNALALRFGVAADRFRTAFGNPRSLRLHERAARELGLQVCVQENPRLALDLDVPADLDLLAGLHHDG
jgi:2-phospho-L-lactate guanylyltransferase